MLRKLRYFFEYAALRAAFWVFGLLSPDQASALGGLLGRTIGPRLAVSRKALRNLQEALPDRNERERQTILSEMWENLGRVMGEYPHLEFLARERVEIVNSDWLGRIRDDGREAVLFGAHLANWELTGIGLLARGLETHAVVRAPNNPLTARLLERQRTLNGRIPTIAKSSAGARQLVRTLREHRHIGILIDQKYNEGIESLFFGRPAMTSPAFVELSQRFSCPLVPVRFERLKGATFRFTFYEPVPVTNPDGTIRDVAECIAEAHSMLERWILDRPGQWIWLHRRWKSGAGAPD
ncbi:MAG: lipid A biosynthesis acyltransferase [Alphaproteobacteria bacterium]|nr:lipid A biosynthesis acyltransferase [Alphaproteobacteria bacterium]